MTIEEQVSAIGSQMNDLNAANYIINNPVGKKLIQKMKTIVDEKRNLVKKIDVMLKTSKMREKQLALNIETNMKESQRKMIEDFFHMMKIEIKNTCEQAREIRKENIQRDGTERKLVNIIMVQEQYIDEMRDKSMKFDMETLKSIASGPPIQGGGVFTHALTRLYTQKKAAPPQIKTDAVLDSFFEDIPIKETSIYDQVAQSTQNEQTNDSSEEEDITKLPLKKVIEKLYERLKRKDFKFQKQKLMFERLKQQNHVIKIEFDSLKSVAETWLMEK